MSTNVIRVGIREFREHLPQYLLASLPITITRHGEIVGFYIPARHQPKKAELEALKQAALQLETLLNEHGITEDELLSEFRILREGNKR
jgi:antitoxin (DNA-binding transcriptional repressor) of toxin-antitoxin stability system